MKIDAEKLKEKVTELIASTRQKDWPIAEYYLKRVMNIVDSLQHKQPEVDLEKEIQRYLCEECSSDDEPTIVETARHFYELGLNARKI